MLAVCHVKAAVAAAVKTDDASAAVSGEASDARDTKSENDKKHKQRRWSEVPDANSVPKVWCIWRVISHSNKTLVEHS